MSLLNVLFFIACQTQSQTPHEHGHDHKDGAAENHHEGHHPEGQTKPEPTQTADYTDYGTPLAHETITKASAFLQSPQDYVGKTVRVSGKAADVCQKAGCWIVLSDGEKTMRVTSKDHGFFVDKQGSGRDCEVEGVVISRQKDAERTAHFESESGEGAPIPENDASGDTYYEIDATGIRFYNSML
jgi:hypothetical protein